MTKPILVVTSRYPKEVEYRIDRDYNARRNPNQALFSVMLPGMDGFEILRRLRAESRTPVLMLTARGDDLGRILGLEIGADDYLPKPFNPREHERMRVCPL